jgi:hypothetical protein
MSYAVTGDGVAHYPVEYEICSMGESHPDEMRASIKASRQKAGIPDDKLQGELVTLFGPTVSAKLAIKLLYDLAIKIERDGLAIGRDCDGAIVYETKDGTTRSG